MKLLSDIDVSGKRVFARADLDVPIGTTNGQGLTSNAEIATRLTNLKETVDYLVEHGAAQIIIAGHIDRPSPRLENGKPVIDPKLSTRQLIDPLQKILGREIQYIPDLSHSRLDRESDPRMREDDSRNEDNKPKLFLLENLRFWPGEVANDSDFAKELARLADVYVNEAFGNSHRNHASMVALPFLFADVEDLLEPEGSADVRPEDSVPREPERPDGVHSRRAAGIHLTKEIEVLSALLKNPKKPFVAIVGGAKIETKLPLVSHLSKIADYVLVGGELPKAIENLKLKIENFEHVIVAKLTEDGKDITDESIYQFQEKIANAKTVVWNGPLGLFEEGFDKGSISVAQAIIESPAYEVVGGGETVEFLAKNNLLSKFSFVSSGGGAMLEFLAGKKLPALVVLS